ncbi:SHOCT domain-containing protein [Halarcobacter bivalviorum]|uniref:SHOCT domain-containing protein n=1 Tax=Halarcobacter bivalviorum TaxID=663364 RepID=A0AAX2A6U2_9BACT|nr:SHOCT domain-containing protein [Halarcobacter bivalviorum]AXH13036.1 hypothetical protein ABIV_2061 [Halarcobacter bivalviorum]RXK09160.1 hypothetical protein CRV05_11270 [Halarcobacter bivalviorum]
MFEYMNTNMTMFHGFTMLIFWFIIFFLLLSMFKKEKSSAIDILKKRLAKGEITKEEYKQMKKTLEENE